MDISARVELIAACRATLRAIPVAIKEVRDSNSRFDGRSLQNLLLAVNAALVYAAQTTTTPPPHLKELSSALILSRKSEEVLLLPALWRDTLLAGLHLLHATITRDAFASHELSSTVAEVLMKPAARDTIYGRQTRRILKSTIDEDLGSASERSTPGELLRRPLWPSDSLGKGQSLLGAASFDPSFNAWEGWYAELASGEFNVFKHKKVALLPSEVLAQSVVSINRRISEILAGRARRPLNRVRAIFLGHGEAGKTSVIRSLHGHDVRTGDQAMTRGVKISSKLQSEHGSVVDVTETSTEKDLTIHYWDFGGQVMVHHTHQFFLRSNCLYVIVLDGRRNERATDDARYWLEHVRAYANDAPVLIVGNKVDLAPVHVDSFSLKQLFPNIVDFYPLSCIGAKTTHKAEFARFSREFFDIISGPVLTRQALLTEPEHEVLLRTQKKAELDPFISTTEFLQLCIEFDILTDDGSPSQLIDLFDKLGVVIHFGDIPILDGLLLNPEWLTRAVYEIMYSEKLNQDGGYLNFDGAREILGGNNALEDHLGRRLSYSKEQVLFVIEAMKRFSLLFSSIHDPDRLVVPALLPANQPENDFDRQGAFAYRLRFEGFMPFHIVANLIVDRSHEIDRDQAWRFGARLRSKTFSAEAMVQADEHARTLSVWINGIEGSDYLGVLRDRIHQALGRMTHLRYFEEVHLPGSAALSDKFAGGTWENYRQIRAALWEARGGHPGDSSEDWRQRPVPFVATNAKQYDLNKIRGDLPKMHDRIKILFLAANPMSTNKLDLEEEVRAIQQELRSVRLRDQISFVDRHAVRPDDLIRHVRDEQPNIVHFSGHGSMDGIVLRGEGDSILPVSGPALRQFFAGRGVDLLVLNSCYSEEQARHVGNAVRAIVGTSSALDDEAARRFSVAFYRGLGSGLSFGEAYRDGKDSTVLHGLDDVFVGSGELDLSPLASLDH